MICKNGFFFLLKQIIIKQFVFKQRFVFTRITISLIIKVLREVCAKLSY
jgi:hypothetical protein